MACPSRNKRRGVGWGRMGRGGVGGGKGSTGVSMHADSAPDTWAQILLVRARRPRLDTGRLRGVPIPGQKSSAHRPHPRGRGWVHFLVVP